MDEFRSLLISLNDDIVQNELESMKFYCRAHDIGAGILEQIKRPIQLFTELEKRGLLKPGKKGVLAELFEKVGRRDLKHKLLGTEEPEDVTPRSRIPNAPTVTGTLNETHLNDISEDLGRDWKHLGRKLGITTTIIENIDYEYRRVKEKSFQMMVRWKKQNGNQATGQALADNLTLIGRKDVAELLARVCQRGGVIIEGAEAQNVQGPGENIEKKGPLETMPRQLRMGFPTQELANPKVKPKKDKKDRLRGAVVADGPGEPEPEHTEKYERPNQETRPPVVQRLGNILDPDRYFVVKQIGSGSCGKVYLCKTNDGKHRYAVKQVELGMNHEETKKQVKYLKKEIEILKKLRHRYIVALYHSEDTAQTVSIFMEYLSGGSISDYVNTYGEMQEQLVRKYTYQILKGCEYLHENNVIHRDIKGANVLVDDHENIRLADFGIAKDLQNVLTSFGTMVKGTIYWCSPEHFDDGRPTYVFDIWSIGCTVIEMLTTKPPNCGLRYPAAMKKILDRNVHPPTHLTPLAKEFIEMCFKVKEDRPTAAELLNNEFPTETATYVPEAASHASDEKEN